MNDTAKSDANGDDKTEPKSDETAAPKAATPKKSTAKKAASKKAASKKAASKKAAPKKAAEAEAGETLTEAQAAKAVGVPMKEVFAFKDHGDFVRVVTVDGRKLEA